MFLGVAGTVLPPTSVHSKVGNLRLLSVLGVPRWSNGDGSLGVGMLQMDPWVIGWILGSHGLRCRFWSQMPIPMGAERAICLVYQ